MFEWRNDYSVEIGSVDAQHKMLFAIANELYTAMMAGQSKPAMGGILDRLVQYTQMHFAHEERLLRQHGYPGFSQHKAQHDALTAKVVKFQSDFQQGHVSMSVQLLHFLKDWLEHHIQGSDRGYSPFLKAKSVA